MPSKTNGVRGGGAGRVRRGEPAARREMTLEEEGGADGPVADKRLQIEHLMVSDDSEGEQPNGGGRGGGVDGFFQGQERAPRHREEVIEEFLPKVNRGKVIDAKWIGKVRGLSPKVMILADDYHRQGQTRRLPTGMP